MPTTLRRLAKESAGPILVSLAAALILAIAGGAAYATGSVTAPIRFVFHPFDTQPKAGASFRLHCPPNRPMTVEAAGRLVSFRLYSLAGYDGAHLIGVTLMPPCSNQPKASPAVELDYVIDGTPVQLIEGLAQHPGQALTLGLKGSGPGTYPWTLVTLDGSTYAVAVLPKHDKFGDNGGVSGAMWQEGTTIFSLNSTASVPCATKPDCFYNPGMTMQTLVAFVQHLTSL